MNQPDLTRTPLLRGEAQGPESPDSQHYQTYGPTLNEAFSDYAVGGGAHHIVVAERMSPDVALGHHARIVAFYRKMGRTPDLTPTPREMIAEVLKVNRPARQSAAPDLIVIPRATPPALATSTVVTIAEGGFGQAGFGRGRFGG